MTNNNQLKHIGISTMRNCWKRLSKQDKKQSKQKGYFIDVKKIDGGFTQVTLYGRKKIGYFYPVNVVNIQNINET